MPAKSKLKVFRYQGFAGGLNLQDPSSLMKSNELFVLNNFAIGVRGELFVSPDGSIDENSQTLMLVNSDEIIRFESWRDITPTDHLIAVSQNGRIFTKTGTTWTDTGKDVGASTSHKLTGIGIAGAGGKVYVSSPGMVSNVHSWDGTTWATVAGFPKAKVLIYRNDRMYAISTNSRSSGIEFSGIGTPETFASADYISVDPQTGYHINAALEFGDNLLIFKDRSIFQLSGRNPSSFSLYKIDSKRGCYAPNAVLQHRGLVYFFDRETGFWSFDGSKFELVSQRINDFMLSDQDDTYAYLAAASVIDDQIYLTIPNSTSDPFLGSSRSTTYIFNPVTKGWSIETIQKVLCTEFWKNEWYFGSFVNASVSKKIDSVGGKQCMMKTAVIPLVGFGTSVRIGRVEMTVLSKRSHIITVGLWRNYDDPDGVPFLTKEIERRDFGDVAGTLNGIAGGPVDAGAHVNVGAGDGCTTSVTWATAGGPFYTEFSSSAVGGGKVFKIEIETVGMQPGTYTLKVGADVLATWTRPLNPPNAYRVLTWESHSRLTDWIGTNTFRFEGPGGITICEILTHHTDDSLVDVVDEWQFVSDGWGEKLSAVQFGIESSEAPFEIRAFSFGVLVRPDEYGKKSSLTGTKPGTWI